MSSSWSSMAAARQKWAAWRQHLQRGVSVVSAVAALAEQQRQHSSGTTMAGSTMEKMPVQGRLRQRSSSNDGGGGSSAAVSSKDAVQLGCSNGGGSAVVMAAAWQWRQKRGSIGSTVAASAGRQMQCGSGAATVDNVVAGLATQYRWPLAQPRGSTMREEHAAFRRTKLLLKEAKRGLHRAPKWILWELKLILVRLKCMCILPRSLKRCTWIVMFLSVWY